jgi:hypothetical protein
MTRVIQIQDWAQAEYLKLGHNVRRLVRKAFKDEVALDGVDEYLDEYVLEDKVPTSWKETWGS